MSETRIVGDVLAWLNRQPGCYAWRNNTGTAIIRRRFVKFGDPGSADILCCYRGRFIAIECKTLKGRQSAVQKRWMYTITEDAGGTYYLVRSVEDLERLWNL